MSWSELTEWWLAEVTSDQAYEEVVTPLLLDVLAPESGKRYLDVGCGEGRVMRKVGDFGALVDGVDLNPELLRKVERGIAADLVSLPVRADAYDGAYSVLTLEHVPGHPRFFTEAARVTRAGGVLALVINHPVWTAPNSTPVSDHDGEVLWRPGEYFSDGASEIPAGDGAVTFHHRTMSALLNAAAEAGWSLERMVEQPHHELEDQAGIPRLLACRWKLHAGRSVPPWPYGRSVGVREEHRDHQPGANCSQ